MLTKVIHGGCLSRNSGAARTADNRLCGATGSASRAVPSPPGCASIVVGAAPRRVFIALFIALTGVGAGTVTVPVLILFLGVPAPVAVGIGLMFATAVKLILVPSQIIRKNVVWRTLAFMLAGGVPGVVIGSLFLKHLVTVGSQNLLNALLGSILVTTAAWQIVNFFRPVKANACRVRDSIS